MRSLIHGLLALCALAPGLSSANEDSPAPAGSSGTATAAEGSASSTSTTTTTTTTTTPTTVDDAGIQKWADRFKGSALILDQSITPETLAPRAQLSSLPSYQWWIVLNPRYNIRPDLSLRVRLDLTLEWANSAETTYYREPQFGDMWTQLMYNGIPKFGGIATMVGVQGIWGTSKASMAQGTVVTLGALANLSRTFETRAGDFTISLTGIIGHAFTRSTTASLVGGLSFQCQTADFQHQFCEQVSGREAPYLNLTGALSLRYAPIKRLQVGVSYYLIDAWRYSVPTATLDSSTGGMTTVGSTATDTRQSTNGWFIGSVDFEVVPWLTLSLGYYTYRPVFDDNVNNGAQDPGNSAIGNPFWKPGGASRVFFDITFALDSMYKSIATSTRSRVAATRPLDPTTALGAAPARF